MIDTCKVCGKKFDRVQANQLYCSTACRDENERDRKRKKEFARVVAARKKAAKARRENLAAVSRRAREHGMTYGKYVAMCHEKGVKP